MKKAAILVILLLVTVSAFAQTSPGRFAGAGGAGTTLNDDSCDIGVTPAATLLLPYFEVSLIDDRSAAQDTFFTITNVSNLPQIAHVTVWTDWSVPVLDFNIFLTGYDVQSISLYDVIQRGEVPITSISPVTDHGSISADNDANPAFRGTVGLNCQDQGGTIPANLLAEVQDALTGDTYDFTNAQGIPAGCVVGGMHENAVGYVTIDVARDCTTTLPTDPTYYGTAGDIAYDNVLIGDTFRIGPDQAAGNFAGGTPLVHIRAIPEGTVVPDGAGGFIDNPVVAGDVTFPYTFYDRYTTVADSGFDAADRRQPLPGLWGGRYIEDVLDADTDYEVWREGETTGTPTCANASDNAAIPLTELVRFDESENPTTLTVTLCRFSPCPVDQAVAFPETGAFDSTDTTRFPQDSNLTNDAGGWTYMNLNHTELRPEGSSNWVSMQISADGRYAVDFDAAWLANGCTVNPGVSSASSSTSTFDLGPVNNNPFSFVCDTDQDGDCDPN